MDSHKDAKLKFLPRNLSRAQPTSSKSKRRVTLEDEADEESDRRSVFERLGPGSHQRSEKRELINKPCFEFMEKGECSYGKNCLYQHIKPGRRRDGDKSPDNLRLRFKGRATSKDKDNKIRSQVVVRKAGGGGSDDETGEDSDGWSLDKLESKKELELEQRRKELQQALSALEATEEGSPDVKKSETSGSDSSPERPHKKKKDKASKKKEKKKHKKAAEREVSVEKPRESKRKHESDEEKSTPHKKRKKKKMEKRQESPSPPPPVQMPVGGKGKKTGATSKPPKETDLYNPESPTSPIAPVDGSHDVSRRRKKQRSSSSSPSPKGKGKKKKKKAKENNQEVAAVAGGRSKKLLSPLMKVLKVKKGPESVSSKRSRSESRDSVPHVHKRSRSASSSSSSSTSMAAGRKKKTANNLARETVRKKSKSQEKKKRPVRSRRSASSSSSESSSSSSPSPSKDRRKGKKEQAKRQNRSGSRNKKDRSVSTGVRGHRDVQVDKRKQDAWQRDTRDPSPDLKRPKAVEDRGRPRDREGRKDDHGGREAVNHRRNLSQRSKESGNDIDSRRDGGKDQRDSKGDSVRASERERDRERDISKGGGRGADARRSPQRDRTGGERDRAGEKGVEREREISRGDRERDLSRGGDREREVGRGAEKERDKGRGGDRERDLSRGGDREREMGRGVDRERELSRGGDRERDIGRGGDRERDMARGVEREREMGRGENRERERGRRAGSLDRDQGERLRRGQEFNVPHQLNQQNDRVGRFGPRGEGDRSFEEPARFGQFPDRPRGGFDRGDSFDRRDQRGFDGRMERGRPGFPGPGRGRERSWERGDERDGFRGEMDRGREMRGFGEFRGDERMREFGSGFRDDRRGGREERLLPFPPGGSDVKGPPPGPDMREGGRVIGAGDERMLPRGPGFGARDDDWKKREGSQESRDRERDTSRGRRGEESGGGDGRVSRGSGKTDSSSRDKVQEREGKVKGSGDAPSSKGASEAAISNKPGVAALTAKATTAKEESPLTRDEPSLASLFSQTETAPVKKKAPAKSFGGKKSPKSSDDAGKTSDKSKIGVGGRLGPRRNNRASDRKGPPPRSGDAAKNKETSKEDSKTASKSEDAARERTPSPKGSQRGSDTGRSASSQARASKRSRSPESKASSSVRSPAPKRSSDSRKASRSPAPVSHRETEGKDSRVSSPAPNADSSKEKKKEEEPKKDKDVEKDEGARSRPATPTGQDSRSSAQAVVSPAKKVGETKKAGEAKKVAETKKVADTKKMVDKTKPRRKSSDSESHPAKLDEGDIAAAMLMDGIDDGQQDEKVFSDWSDDDDADNILMGGESRKNLVEDLDHQPYDMEPRHRRSPAGMGRYSDGRYGRMADFDNNTLGDILLEKPALEKNIPNVKILEDTQKEKPVRERKRRNTDDEGYEEISSDENDLEEEGDRTNRRTIVSILDIDISSLIPASKPRVAPGPVFQRYKACAVFGDLGLSRAYAGEDLYAEVQATCQKQLEKVTQAERSAQELDEKTAEEASKSAEKASVGIKKETVSIKTEPGIKIKKEPGTEEEMDTQESEEAEADTASVPPEKTSTAKAGKTPALTALAKPEFKLYGNTSAYHKFNKARAMQKSVLTNNAKLFKRALTARKDLDIRRQLCKIDPKYDQGAVYPSGIGDVEFTRQCVQLFRQKRPVGLPPPPVKVT